MSLTLARTITNTLTIATLCGATLLAHGWCLSDGTVLDDHWHQKGLREHGWSPTELLKTLSIEPSRWMQHWWQDEPVRWEYARPLFILTMKLVYGVIGRDDPLALHAYSVLLHAACVLMVWRLALLVTENRFWSVVAALVFAVYPHAVMTVQWNSSQNCVQQTALTLAAMLMFLRAAHIRIRAVPGGSPHISPPALSSNPALLVASIAVWFAAVLTKENAIVLPAILLVIDLIFAGRRNTLRRWPAYLAFGVLGIAFIAWRAAVLTVGMPEVYIRRPSGDWAEYGVWLCAKLLHYLCTSIWPAPMTIGPTGRYNPWVESPGDSLLMLAIVGGLTFAYVRVTRGLRGRWIWPLWIFLAVLPVTPVIATAHSGYFGGVGFAIALVLGPAAYATRNANERRDLASSPTTSPSRHGRWSGLVAIGTLLIYAALTMLNRWQWSGIIAAERLVPAWVAASPPPRIATDVFFINLPFVNVYAAPALERAGVIDPETMRVHVLTYAPQPVMMEQRTTIEQIDDHTFSVAIEGQPYFSRLLGRFLLDGFRSGGALRQGDEVATPHFAVRIAAADALGVQRIEFRFPQPLQDPAYCFYLTTVDCAAGRLRFRPMAEPLNRDRPASVTSAHSVESVNDAAARLERGDALAAEALFAALGGSDLKAAALAESTLRRVGGFVAQATGAPIQQLLLGPAVPIDDLAPPPRIRKPPPPPSPPALSSDQWAQVRLWWQRHVDQTALDELWANRARFAALIKAREEVPHARQWAALLLRTDLYLTGPPFPGPRVRD